MLTVKAKIPAHADYEPILPLAVPDLKEVKAFANHLHSLDKHWRGEIFGWQAEYTPQSDKKPFKLKDEVYSRQFLDRRKRHLVFLIDVGAWQR